MCQLTLQNFFILCLYAYNKGKYPLFERAILPVYGTDLFTVLKVFLI